MTRVGTVASLWRYPVKSMGGERLVAAALTWRGIPGDRGWAVYDVTRRGITGAKRLPPLRACQARYASEPEAGAASPAAEITLPDGTRVRTDAADAAERLGEAVGRPVALEALGSAGSDTAPRLTSQGDSDETVRALMGLEPGEPMPDMSEFPPERLQLLRQGNFFDALPIHLLTSTTLRSLQRVAPESAWDERRFRPNLLVDSIGAEDYPELGWLARRLRVGGAMIDVVAGCPRCVMVTQPVDELPQDHRVMRTLVREAKHTAGIYASVVQEGVVRVGDAVERVD
jgi:uncharacterized protein YcbX